MSSTTSSDQKRRLKQNQMRDIIARDPITRCLLLYMTPRSKKLKNKTTEQEQEGCGILSPPAKNAKDFIPAVAKIIDYTFKNADILEEALEAPGNGWRLVGQSKKMLKEGNTRLASVGEDVLRLIVSEYCYKIGLDHGEIGREISKVFSKQNFDRIGRRSKLEKYVRLRRSSGTARGILGDRMTKLDSSTTKAILGAVFHDGGLDAARKTVVALKICEDLGIEV